MITRREALKRVLLLGGGTISIPKLLQTTPLRSAEPVFVFGVLNDLHLMTPDCAKFLKAVLTHLKAQGADFCLVAGDLTEKGDLENMEAVKDTSLNVGLTCYPVPGNHDYSTSSDKSNYEKTFPDRLNYTFSYKGWQFVGLDSTEGQKYQNTTISQETIQWLTKQINQLSSTAPTVVFTHFPLIPFVPFSPNNSETVLKLLKTLNVKAIFCGHYHGYVRVGLNSTEICINYCCSLKRNNHDGTSVKGYYLCKVYPNKLAIEHVSFYVSDGMPVLPESDTQSL